MAKRYLYWWLTFATGYIFPFAYFAVKLGITKQAVTLVMPVVMLGIMALFHLCIAIPKWTATWRPSFLKGLLKHIPVFALFVLLITLGLLLAHTIKISVAQEALYLYFEVVLVLLGSACVSAVFSALHQKYKELDLIAKGYVLGVVNNK